jgi:D12 class N6 adenine-specific DNA methyltransferase
VKAPFPWFGGKSRVAHLVWDRFGDVRNYVEPFAGSLAVLLGRPTDPKIETVNDLDCWIANFWRALQADPEQLAQWADWPVNEADLHARHLWLVKQADFCERMKTDPDFYDVKIAGWWVWGISQWIGSGWCAAPGSNLNRKLGRADGTPQRGRPCMQPGALQQVTQKRPYLTNHGGGMGVHGGRKRPRLGNDHGRGVLNAEAPNQIPDLSGDSGAAGRGIHASGLITPGRTNAGRAARGVVTDRAHSGLYEWFYSLADRLRRVRVCCGDWTRILGPAPTTCIGLTGVFLDPPYAVEDRSDVYGEESRDVAHAVREWALANGDNPDLRIALCGYDGEHAMPGTWTEIAWKANGGFGNQGGETQGRTNARRERIWFSPHCLCPQGNLFALDASGATIPA